MIRQKRNKIIEFDDFNNFFHKNAKSQYFACQERNKHVHYDTGNKIYL